MASNMKLPTINTDTPIPIPRIENRAFKGRLSRLRKMILKVWGRMRPKLRQIFQEVIEKISIKVSKRKEGKRHRYTLLGGEIHLQLLEAPNLHSQENNTRHKL